MVSVRLVGADVPRLTVPQAARRLGINGADVYMLIFRGELEGGPSEDGAVYVPVAAAERYARDHAPGGQPAAR